MTAPNDADLTGRDVRRLCRSGRFDRPTAGVAMGFAQANLVVLPGEWADEFERFCRLNDRPCPLMEVTEPGCAEAERVAPGSDVRTDLPRYRVFRRGECIDRPQSIEKYWTDDCVAFLIGCSFTFDAALLAAGVPVRHVEQGRNVPMYRTNIDCTPAGRFRTKLIVSMRPMTVERADVARGITAAMPHSHGAPVHVGDAAAIGIADLNRADFGDAVTVAPDEVPVFWACGVTPMAAVMEARPDLAITHEPGHMFVTDLRADAPQDA